MNAAVPSPARGRVALLGAALLLCIAAADVAFWWIGTHRLEQGFERWAAAIAPQGWQVWHDAPRRAGFPFAARLVLPRFRLAGGQATLPGGLDWAADRLTLSISPVHPLRLEILPEGNERLRLSGMPEATFTADLLRAVVPLGAPRLEHLTVEGTGLAGGLAPGRRQDVRIDGLTLTGQLHAPPHDAPWGHDAGEITLMASNILLPDTHRWPLGGTVSTLAVEADFISPLLGAGDPRAEAEAWRDGHGSIHVERFGLRWGPLDVSAEAGFVLDADLQPAGSGQAVLTGHAEALDALAKGGALPEGVASTAEAVLGLMAAPDRGGGKPGAVRLPFALKASTLSVGHIPLFKFGRIAWRGHA